MANPVTPYLPNNSVPEQSEGSQLWQERYRIAYTNQLPLFKRFADWYDGMYTIVNAKNYALWRSKVQIPILAAKAWNLMGKLLALKPGFEVRPRQTGELEEDVGVPSNIEEAADKAQLLLEYDYDNPNLKRSVRSSLQACLMDCTVTGTGLAKVPWEACEEVKYEHPTRSDGTVDMSKEKVTTTHKGYNGLIPVNIFNVFVAPASTDLYNSPWVIIKDWKTQDQLQEVNDGQGVEVYKNLDKLGGFRATGDPLTIYKKSRNRMTVQYDPIIADRTVDWVEIYECFERDSNEIITYANAGRGGGENWVEIRRLKNPYWHGKYPLVRFVLKQRPFDFWGEGLWETNHTLQVAANDVFNHYLDNWDLSVDGMLMAQESAGINDYIVEPGGLITYRTEEPKQFKFPEPNPASLNFIMEQIMQAVENNSISNYSMGTSQDSTDKTRGTKGGIEALQNAADDLVAFFRANFQESIKEIGVMWLSNNKQFMQLPENISQVKNHELQVTKVRPEDLQYDMELRVDEASMQPVSDDQVKQEFGSFIAQLTGLQQASMAQHTALGTQPIALDFGQIFEEMGEKWGFRNTRQLIAKLPPGTTPVQAQQMVGMAGDMAKAQPQQAPAQEPPQNPQDKMLEQINYKDAPPDIQRQMEQQAGMQPSQLGAQPQTPPPAPTEPLHQGDLQNLKIAHELHAQGRLHPAVLNAVRQHMGLEPIPEAPLTPGGALPTAPPHPLTPPPVAPGASGGAK